MNHLETFYSLLVVIQLLHSQEEIHARFDKRWPVWKMSRKFFVTVEIMFSVLIISVALFKSFPKRELFMITFNIFMFANGIWHLMWAGVEKRYVPGLVTAPLFIIVFSIFYFGLFKYL